MRWMVLGFPIVILMDIIMFVNFTFYGRSMMDDIKQRQLDLQVNYATDAAAQDLLSMGTHLNTDYENWGNMEIEPELALSTFKECLRRNLGWSDSMMNNEAIEASVMPFFIVAGYDGYYVYYQQRTSREMQTANGTVNIECYDKVWTPKLPYAEDVEVGGNVEHRFYNLGDKVYGTFKPTSNASKGIVKLDNPLVGAAIDEANECIASTLQAAANAALYAGVDGNVLNNWIIPVSFSQWSTNRSIESVSILTYIVDYNANNRISNCSYGLSGAKIDEPMYCILYNRNDVQCYTYVENRPAVEAAGCTIIEVVNSPDEAASRGYYFDVEFIGG